MAARRITKQQARRFMLLKQGLLGEKRFAGKEGVLAFVRQAGCVQFDPIDACGKSPELTLFSRVQGFSKELLYEMLYKDRSLVDYFDKNLAIIPVEDWKYFARTRKASEGFERGREAIKAVEKEVLRRLEGMECASPKELGLSGSVDWHWSTNATLGRAVLEQLYFEGKLCVHHKKGTIRHYALASKLLPEHILCGEDPNKTQEQLHDWGTLRRIGAVSLLGNGPSDAWLGIEGYKAAQRAALFERLIQNGSLQEIAVDGLDKPLYMLAADEPFMDAAVSSQEFAPRMEFLAPLDSFMWDRNVIEKLFDFYYRWEIYTPAQKRQYGYYVLPILYGEEIIGRIEPVVDRKNKVLRIENIWYEKGFKKQKGFTKELRRAVKDLATFNDVKEIQYK